MTRRVSYKRMSNESEKKKEILLVLRSQTGDREAFDELLRSIQSALYRYIRRLTGDETLSMDILQETFLIIYRKIMWLEDPLYFRAWAYRIASRQTLRRLKKEKAWMENVRENEFILSVPAGNEKPAYDPELVRQIPALLARISPASRAVIILHYLDEMTLAETSEILGLSMGTIKSRLAYGLEKLRLNIKKEE